MQGGNAKPEDVFTVAVQNVLKNKSLFHASLAVGTTKDELQALIDTAIKEGQSVKQLAKAIGDQFDIDGRVRPLRIARTELTDTINDGTVQTIDKQGYRQKEWSTVIDGRERETHAAADGQVVGINDPFRVGGATCQYPGDDSLPPELRINCRCVTLAAGLPEDRRRIMGDRFLRAHGQLEKSLVIHLRREFERQRRRILSNFPT
jgi:SPP1 gp7 family putative phage head morphogenesis protein